MQYRQLLVSLAANVGAFLFGNLLGWSAPAAGQVIGDEIYGFPVSDFQFAWVVGLMALGGVLSCLLSGIIRSKIGTRLTILLFGVPLLVGWVLIAIPISPAMVSHKIKILDK